MTTLSAPVLSERTFRRICSLMYDAIGLSLSDAKKPMVTSRLSQRLRQLDLDSYEDYLALIEDDDNASEFQMAVDLLTTNETYFFREPHHYEFLEQDILGRRLREPLSLWSAASSFGDEAYSTAMLLTDLQKKGQVHADWGILATDISQRVLMAAKQGVFPKDRFRNVSPERLKRYCLRGEGPAEGQVMVGREIRSRVRFGQLNLCLPFEGIGPFDFVFLRNVLIYFDQATKVDVTDRVASLIRPGGLLFLGTAEGRVNGQVPLKPEIPGVFRKP